MGDCNVNVESSDTSADSSVNSSDKDNIPVPDSEGYQSHIDEAKNHPNLNPIKFSECVQVFQDTSNRPVIVFIPKLALDKCRHEPEDEVVKRMLLYFVLVADEVVRQRYTLIYCHTSVNLLSQTSLITEYYKIMPRRYKKNLDSLVVIHPTFSIKMFFEFTRVLVSSKFYSKLKYVEDVVALQEMYPPRSGGAGCGWQLPPMFLYWEDTLMKGLKEHRVDDCGHVSRYDICREFVPALQAPLLVHRCIKRIRAATSSGSGTGMARDGLFRISGDQTVRSLVRLRLQYCSCDEAKQFPGNEHCIAIGDSSEAGFGPVPPAGCGARRLSTVVVTDMDSIGGALKLAVGSGRRPLIVHEVYTDLMNLTRELLHPPITVIPSGVSSSMGLGGGPGAEQGPPMPSPPSSLNGVCTPPPAATVGVGEGTQSYPRFGEWRAAVQKLFDTLMPAEHTATLNYLLRFLAEVSSHAAVNRMTADNLSIVFSPILLRGASPDADPVSTLQDLGACKLAVKLLILEQVELVRGQSSSAIPAHAAVPASTSTEAEAEAEAAEAGNVSGVSDSPKRRGRPVGMRL